MTAAADIAKLAAWVEASSPAKRPAPQYGWVQVPPWAVLLPLAPDSPASAVDLSEIGEASMPLLCAAVALPAPVLDQRLDWDCTGIGTVSDRLHHILHHVPESRWDVPRVVAVGITSPSQSMNAALAAEGLSVDLTETAVLFCPLYAVTSKDRSRAQEVCRASYTIAA